MATIGQSINAKAAALGKRSAPPQPQAAAIPPAHYRLRIGLWASARRRDPDHVASSRALMVFTGVFGSSRGS